MKKRRLSFGAWFAVGVGASALLSGCSSGSGTPGGGGAAPIGGSPSSGGNTSPGGTSNSNAGTGAVQPGAGNGGSTAQGGQTAGGGAGNGGAGNAGAGNNPPGGSSGDWKEGLTQGPNGLVPWIVVDQFGYRAQDPKVALLRDPRQGYDAATDFTPGASYAVVDAKTGAKVKQGAPQAWNNGAVDPKSGDAVWSFDFSDVTAVGTYYVVDEQTGRRSPEFEIGPGVYRNVLRHAMRTFFYQRAGFEKKAEFAGAEWADAASHLQPGQDGETHDWLDKTNASKVKDLRGGWYDAGDYNKYTNWHARYLITLLRSFVRHPTVFGDDSGIPESGNGTPDVLDEVKFGLDWLVRMQNEDGSLLCVQTLGSGTPPSSAKDPSYYGPPTTAATLAGAAAFAYAARVFSARAEASLKQAAEDYVARAKKAWAFAEANPSLSYFNNDDAKQPGSKGLAAGQQEVDDKGRLAFKVEAAAYLFERTGEESYRDFFDKNYATVTPNYASYWEIERHEAALDYAMQKGATASVVSDIKTKFLGQIKGDGAVLQSATTHQEAYRAPLSDYTWGSNQVKAGAGRLLLLIEDYELEPATAPAARAAAADYLHYLHGVNPLGLVFLTNMDKAGAENSAKTLYHTWFAYRSTKWQEVGATTPGPAPGFLVGGPNPSYTLDGCCTDGTKCYGSADFSFCALALAPPLEQPPAKSYLQFNHGWPANSWAVTENSNGYQVQYIRLLSSFID